MKLLMRKTIRTLIKSYSIMFLGKSTLHKDTGPLIVIKKSHIIGISYYMSPTCYYNTVVDFIISTDKSRNRKIR